MRIKDLDNLHIEDIIRLPFFYSLEKVSKTVTKHWKITFKCNKITTDGNWALLDEIFDTEFVVRYKMMEFKP